MPVLAFQWAVGLLCRYSVLAFQWSEGAVDTRDMTVAGPNRRLDDEHSVPAGESLPILCS